MEADGVVEAVFGFCLDNISSGRVALNVKAGLFDKVGESIWELLLGVATQISKKRFLCCFLFRSVVRELAGF